MPKTLQSAHTSSSLFIDDTDSTDSAVNLLPDRLLRN